MLCSPLTKTPRTAENRCPTWKNTNRRAQRTSGLLVLNAAPWTFGDPAIRESCRLCFESWADGHFAAEAAAGVFTGPHHPVLSSSENYFASGLAPALSTSLPTSA